MAEINFGWSFKSFGAMTGAFASSLVFKRCFRSSAAKTRYLFAALATQSALQMVQPYCQ